MVYLMEKPLPKKKEKAEGKEEKTEEEASPRGRRPGGMNGAKAEGTELVIFNPLTEAKHSFKDVVDYNLGKDGETIAFVQSTTDSTKIKHFTLNLFNVSDESVKEIFTGDGDLKKLTMNDDGTKQAFMFTSDTSDVKVYSLYLGQNGTADKVVDCNTAGMKEDWSVSENGTLQFSDSGNRLFFGTAEKPVEEPEDKRLKEEKYSLDIWSWHDDLLQPQQKVNLSREKGLGDFIKDKLLLQNIFSDWIITFKGNFKIQFIDVLRYINFKFIIHEVFVNIIDLVEVFIKYLEIDVADLVILICIYFIVYQQFCLGIIQVG